VTVERNCSVGISPKTLMPDPLYVQRAVDFNELAAHGEKRKTGQVVTYTDVSVNSDSDSITAPVFACL